MAADDFEVILFDIGNVLVVLPPMEEELERVAPGSTGDIEASLRRVHGLIIELEIGACDPESFAQEFVQRWPLEMAPEAFLEAFTRWPKGAYPGTHPLLDRLAENYTLACISDTNEAHWPRIRDEMDMGRHFARRYLSFELGLVKPDVRFYDHVLEDLACSPNEILYFDDREEHCAAARGVGITSYQVHGIDAVQAALTGLNIKYG